MRARDRSLLAGLAIAGLLAAFWFMVLSPKREEAAALQERVEQLQAAVDQQEQVAAAAEQSRQDFDSNYQRLVVLGKAVPEDADTSSLLYQLEEIARDAKVSFTAIRLQDAGGAEPAAAPAAEQTTTDQNQEGEDDDGDDGGDGGEAPPPPAPPTEPAVAGLPIGASVGPAGLPLMPYTVEVEGTFFQLADFMDGVDALVRPRGQRPRVHGRLVTVDGFSLEAADDGGFPRLSASFAVNTFITPAEQGLTAGASPAGPPPAIPTADTTPPAP